MDLKSPSAISVTFRFRNWVTKQWIKYSIQLTKLLRGHEYVGCTLLNFHENLDKDCQRCFCEINPIGCRKLTVSPTKLYSLPTLVFVVVFWVILPRERNGDRVGGGHEKKDYDKGFFVRKSLVTIIKVFHLSRKKTFTFVFVLFCQMSSLFHLYFSFYLNSHLFSFCLTPSLLLFLSPLTFVYFTILLNCKDSVLGCPY